MDIETGSILKTTDAYCLIPPTSTSAQVHGSAVQQPPGERKA